MTIYLKEYLTGFIIDGQKLEAARILLQAAFRSEFIIVSVACLFSYIFHPFFYEQVE